MQELEVINNLLGGHSITIKGFKKCVGAKKNVSVCEIGCGGGDNLKAIHQYAENNGLTVTMIGIDIKKDCIDYARENCRSVKNVEWICADYKNAKLENSPDIIFSSLFCHHFTDEGVQEVFQWMIDNAQLGFFMNDLHRHPMAYYSIKILTGLFSGSYLVKNDAPISVLRGFHKHELLHQVKNASAKNEQWLYELKWQWAFRWLLTAIKKKH